MPPDKLSLESGKTLGPIDIVYETYGELDRDNSNAILVFHALSGDAHAAGYHSHSDPKPGWWDNAIGPAKAFDTNRYFVICANVIGGCQGSTGPSSINPDTGKPFGLKFPLVTVKDTVKAEAALLDHLGIGRVLATVGGSMGGFRALQFALSYPERCRLIIPIATSGRQSAQNIAFNEIGRRAIMADPHWNGGDYYGSEFPAAGLSIARMVGHVTYLSDDTLKRKFGRRAAADSCGGQDDPFDQPYFAVESYLRHKGKAFTRRFDANSYLYITKAIDLFDLAPGCELLEPGFRNCKSRFLVISFTSDWLYPPYQSEDLVNGIRANGLSVKYHMIESRYGHDAFLLEADKMKDIISRFLDLDGTKKHYEVEEGYPIS